MPPPTQSPAPLHPSTQHPPRCSRKTPVTRIPLSHQFTCIGSTRGGHSSNSQNHAREVPPWAAGVPARSAVMLGRQRAACTCRHYPHQSWSAKGCFPKIINWHERNPGVVLHCIMVTGWCSFSHFIFAIFQRCLKNQIYFPNHTILPHLRGIGLRSQ